MVGARDVGAIAALLEKRKELLVECKRITMAQAERLKAKEIDAFIESVDERQEIIDKIKRLHQEMENLLKSYAPYKAPESPRTLELSAETREMMREILLMDEENIKLAAELKGEIGTETKQMSQGRKSLRLYNPIDSEMTSGFLDTKS